jgi:hypothetical protein
MLSFIKMITSGELYRTFLPHEKIMEDRDGKERRYHFQICILQIIKPKKLRPSS